MDGSRQKDKRSYSKVESNDSPEIPYRRKISNIPGLSPRAHLHVVGMLRFMYSTKANRACPLLLSCSCIRVCLYGPFNCILFHNSPGNSPLSHSVLLILLCLIGPFNYISLYESLPQPWVNPLWLTGLKAPTNKLSVPRLPSWSTLQESLLMFDARSATTVVSGRNTSH